MNELKQLENEALRLSGVNSIRVHNGSNCLFNIVIYYDWFFSCVVILYYIEFA